MGVEAEHRSFGSTKNGYNDGGEPLIHNTFKTSGGHAYHNQYPNQMFDRKLRPMDTCYVGLVCTRRDLGYQHRAILVRQTPDLKRIYDSTLSSNSGDAEAATNAAISPDVECFYTFHYACFSTNQAWEPKNSATYDAKTGSYEGVEELNVAKQGYAEPSSKKANKHYEDANVGETYDPYIGPSRAEFEGMVGAWKVGQVLDISAKKRDQYTGGPVDTATAVTVNVNVEFKDWRALRRSFGRDKIGRRVPGARAWKSQKLPKVLENLVLKNATPGDANSYMVRAAPSREQLRQAQSKHGDGYTEPLEDSLERDRYKSWLGYLWMHARDLAINRLSLREGKKGMNEALTPGKSENAFDIEINNLFARGLSSRDDERVLLWPTMYQPLLEVERNNILDSTASTDHRVRDFSFIAYPVTAVQTENVRYKLLMNMPIDPRTLDSLAELIGPTRDPNQYDVSIVKANDDWNRALIPDISSYGADVGYLRRAMILKDAYRRDGYGNMPSNRMMAEPYALSALTFIGTPQYAFYPVGYDAVADIDDYTVLANEYDLKDNDGKIIPGYKPDFTAGGWQQQELYDLASAPLDQQERYILGMTYSRNLRTTYNVDNLRGVLRELHQKPEVASQRSYLDQTTFRNDGSLLALGPTGRSVQYLWQQILKAASKHGEGSRGVVGLRGYLQWACDEPALQKQDPNPNLPGGMPELLTRWESNALILQEKGEVLEIVSNRGWNSMVPGDELETLVGSLPDQVKLAVRKFVVDYLVMDMEDNGPGITIEDFINHFAPVVPEEDERLSGVLKETYNSGVRRSVSMAPSDISAGERFVDSQLHLLRMVRDSEDVHPFQREARSAENAAAWEPPTTTIHPTATSSIEEVVMTNTEAPRVAGKAVAGKAVAGKAVAGKAVATPPARRPKVPSGTTDALAGALRPPRQETGPSLGTSPQQSLPVSAPAVAALPPTLAQTARKRPADAGAATDAGAPAADGPLNSKTSLMISSIFGGGGPASGSTPTAVTASGAIPEDDPVSDDGAGVGGSSASGSSGRSRVRRPRDGR